jgi:hypothetical protein
VSPHPQEHNRKGDAKNSCTLEGKEKNPPRVVKTPCPGGFNAKKVRNGKRIVVTQRGSATFGVAGKNLVGYKPWHKGKSRHYERSCVMVGHKGPMMAAPTGIEPVILP